MHGNRPRPKIHNIHAESVAVMTYGIAPAIVAIMTTQNMNAEAVHGTGGLKAQTLKPTVSLASLGATYVGAYTYGCDDDRISPTHCAVIDAGLDGRCRQRRACRTPPVRASSAHSALVAGVSHLLHMAFFTGLYDSRGQPYVVTPRIQSRTCLQLAVLPHGAESWSCAWQRWKVACL